MIHLGLDQHDMGAYVTALHNDHDMRLRVTVYNLSGVAQRELTFPTQRVNDGTVDVDTTADVTRALTMELVDPKRAIVLDPSSPSHAAVFADNLIGVRHEIYVLDLGRWISCPIFKGPVTGFARQGEIVNIECQGKEILCLEPNLAWTVKTYRKSSNIVRVARDILYQAGERAFDMDAAAKTSPTRISIAKHDERWRESKKLLHGIHRQLFYDGRGYVRARVLPTKPHFTFYHENKYPAHRPPCVITKPQLTYGFNFANTVEVLGPEPTGHKPRVQYTAVLPRNHPLSPWALGRNGVPRHIVFTEENDKIKRVLGEGGAKERALHLLNILARLDVDASFESLPMPFLEEADMVSLVNETGAHSFRMRQFSIPLTSAGTMTVGFLSRPRAKTRKKK